MVNTLGHWLFFPRKFSDRKNKKGEVKILDLLHSIGADFDNHSKLEKELKKSNEERDSKSRGREIERGGKKKKPHKGALNELTPEVVVQGSDTASWYPQVFFFWNEN